MLKENLAMFGDLSHSLDPELLELVRKPDKEKIPYWRVLKPPRYGRSRRILGGGFLNGEQIQDYLERTGHIRRPLKLKPFLER